MPSPTCCRSSPGCPATPRSLAREGRLVEACLAYQEDDRRTTEEDTEALRQSLEEPTDVRLRVHELRADEETALLGSDLLSATDQVLLEVTVEARALPGQATSVDVTAPWLRDGSVKLELPLTQPLARSTLHRVLPPVPVPAPVPRISESIVVEPGGGSRGWDDARAALKLLTLTFVDIGPYRGRPRLSAEEARVLQAELRAEARKREDLAERARETELARARRRDQTVDSVLRLTAAPACSEGSTPTALKAGGSCRWYVLEGRSSRSADQLELVAPTRLALEAPPRRCVWLAVPSVTLPKAASRGASLEAWSQGSPRRVR